MKTIETKVIAAMAGGGAGAAVASFIAWLLGVTIWHASNTAGQAAQAVEAVPLPVSGFVGILLAALGALASGYAAPHTASPADSTAPESIAGQYLIPPLDSTVTEVRYPPADATVPPVDTSAADTALADAAAAHPMQSGPTEGATADPTAHTDTTGA